MQRYKYGKKSQKSKSAGFVWKIPQDLGSKSSSRHTYHIPRRKDVLADLAELCLGRHAGRAGDDHITLYKNGGGGHLDLMCARILHRHCEAA